MNLTVPDTLPIADRIEEIKEVISANQVVVIAGETGSGKSTQLPKICVSLGLGGDGKLIGHTQPRRLAARSVAERIAEETQTKVGDLVGYKVRFTDQVSAKSRIKLMTDGILLAEIQRDRLLRSYDTIIIDEAHERSLNIDFLLGYLQQLLPRRPDLKIIVTSATIDTQRFSEHFSDAPIIEVTGRTYPVEVRYRPLEDPHTGDVRDQAQAIGDAVGELWRDQEGDILVFCSGEREIRDAHSELEDLKLANTEIFPLYARLSAAEQHRVFSSHTRRRIVLATNVAETSLTVPGIRTVIDPGTARISRYSLRTKVQRLPIEKVSQASANQRAGRCGRLGPGVCIRLYSEDDFLARDEFTEPEITRTNLASVILQMASLGLGDIAAFPFVEPPDDRNIRDGIALLEELDAVDPDAVGTKQWLTRMGHQLARLPVDPRLGRMIIEAGHNACLHEVMVIVAALSVQDPRERPGEKRQSADEFHARFAHPTSDFLSYLALWDYVKTERRGRSQGQFRKQCKREFLNFNRIREWQDVYRQLRRVADELDLTRSSDEAKPDDIHYSLLSGLLSHIGMRDDKSLKGQKVGQTKQPQRGSRPAHRGRVEFLGARGAKFVVANDSALAKKPPIWVVAGELVETNRLWARTLTQIDPAWAEKLGEHLVSRSYTEPWWEAERGAALTTERVGLYGLPIVAGRRRNLERFNKPLAREMFIHHALIEGEWEPQHAGLLHEFSVFNARLISDVKSLEARSRQSDLMADQEKLFRFYDERIPASATSSRNFNAWWKKRKKSDPELLHLTRDLLIGDRGERIEIDTFPDHVTVHGNDFPVTYEFDPVSPIDGITIDVAVPLLNHLQDDDFSWLVPGFVDEAVEHLIRSLPKSIRKSFIPVPETAKSLHGELDERVSLPKALRMELQRRSGVMIAEDHFQMHSLPRHLRPTYRIVGQDDATLAAGKSLENLQLRLEDQIRLALETTGHPIERSGITSWDFADIPRQVETQSGDHLVKAYPALLDNTDSVSIRLLATQEEQSDAMWSGIRRLLRLNVAAPLRSLDRQVGDAAQFAIAASQVQSKAQWYLDGLTSMLDHVLSESGGVVFDQAKYESLQALAVDQLGVLTSELAVSLGQIVVAIQALDLAIADISERLLNGSSHLLDIVQPCLQDAIAHRSRLVYPEMLTGVGFHRHSAIAYYLQALATRVQALAQSPRRDLDVMMQCRAIEGQYSHLMLTCTPSVESERVAWMLEDLRARRFAPNLPRPDSAGSGQIAAERVTEKKIKLALRRLS